MILILYLALEIKDVIEAGKEYGWPRLEECPTCGGRRIWGHGYVPRYFDEHPEGIWMKRWRCCECGAIHCARPNSHDRRFQVPASEIETCLRRKIEQGTFQTRKASRQRQQYWYQGLLKQSSRVANGLDLKESINRLLLAGVMLATHSLKYFIKVVWADTPHLFLALTPIKEPR